MRRSTLDEVLSAGLAVSAHRQNNDYDYVASTAPSMAPSMTPLPRMSSLTVNERPRAAAHGSATTNDYLMPMHLMHAYYPTDAPKRSQPDYPTDDSKVPPPAQRAPPYPPLYPPPPPPPAQREVPPPAQRDINPYGKSTSMALWDITQTLCKEWTTDAGAIGCRNIVAAMYFVAKFLAPGSASKEAHDEIMGFFPKYEAWFEYKNRFLGFYIKEKVNGEILRLTEVGKEALESVGAGVKFTVLPALDSPENWAETINNDCSAATKGMIPTIADAITLGDPKMECYLMAAEYVQVIWKELFTLDETEKDAVFHGYIEAEEGGKWIEAEVGGKCQMMKNDISRYNLFEGDNCHGVFLPTKTEHIQILAVLPKAEENQAKPGEKTPIEKASYEIAEWKQQVMRAANNVHKSNVIVQIPRMELKMKPKKIFEKGLGEKSICEKVFPAPMFDEFYRLTETYDTNEGTWKSRWPLEIGRIDHATYIQMDEMGAKAASATGAAIFRSVGASDEDVVMPLLLRFNRPYILYIVDTTPEQLQNPANGPVTLFKVTIMNSTPLKAAPPPNQQAYDEVVAANAQQQAEADQRVM